VVRKGAANVRKGTGVSQCEHLLGEESACTAANMHAMLDSYLYFLRGVQTVCNTSGILPSGPQLYHMTFVNHRDFRKDANKLTLIGM
jgi:hypothetical protein